MSQKDRIMRYLGENGTITPLEALEELGVYRLASRISELRDTGHRIETHLIDRTNRYGDKIRFAKYVLKH